MNMKKVNLALDRVKLLISGVSSSTDVTPAQQRSFNRAMDRTLASLNKAERKYVLEVLTSGLTERLSNASESEMSEIERQAPEARNFRKN